MFHPEEISYYIISLGCSKNLFDSEKLNGAMIKNGFVPSISSEDADIIIINTCGFITTAKEESIEVIFDALDHLGLDEPEPGDEHKVEPHHSTPFEKKLVVMGCLTERYFENIKKEIPEIDLLYRIFDESFMDTMCKKFDIKEKDISSALRQPLTEDLVYSYIKIAEGCSNNCSYCAIPLIRGGHKSFPFDDIIEDVISSASLGVKEAIIVAQDIASYNWEGKNLSNLVEAISGIEAIKWIRLLYCHPDHIDNELIAIMADNAKVVPYIDIPFQHINKDILHSMGRRGDYQTYLTLINSLRKFIPRIAVRSTLMVGYPGETDEMFQELMQFLKEARIDKVGAFAYSPEEGTAAFALKDTVPEEIKKDRYNKIMELQMNISADILEKRIGQTVQVIVEDKIDDGLYIGRTEFDAPDVDGVFYLTAKNAEIKSIVEARITGSTEYDLYGDPV